ncbi:UNVERIFIED_CONTAM: hypothetical protein Slati_2687200 [Sesamum latifolium]|uniref:Uncharacterized protein n=1 Tax=Sesamum latifolium TaxID=2727402 RepID=A0AAW2VX20_9LAMI
MIKNLGLSIEKIHACKNDCMLYWKDDIDMEYCKFCGNPRYKATRDRNPRRKKSTYAVLRYLPLTPHLQRLYASLATAEHMTWHELQAYWDSDEFKAKSAKNKANRVGNPVVASTVYRGGSSSVGMYKRKLEAQLGRPPNRMEETYQKLLEECVSQLASGEVGSSDGTASVVQEDQLWAEAADGKKRAESSAWGLML